MFRSSGDGTHGSAGVAVDPELQQFCLDSVPQPKMEYDCSPYIALEQHCVVTPASAPALVPEKVVLAAAAPVAERGVVVGYCSEVPAVAGVPGFRGSSSPFHIDWDAWYIAVFRAMEAAMNERVCMLFECALTTTIMRLSASAAADFFVTFARKVESVRMGELVRLSASAAADFFVMFARKVDVICGCNKLELNNLVKLEFRHNGSIITSAMISVISARKRHDALGCSGDQGPATASVYSHTLRVCRCVCVCVQVCLCVWVRRSSGIYTILKEIWCERGCIYTLG